jgi:hypothetical protein
MGTKCDTYVGMTVGWMTDGAPNPAGGIGSAPTAPQTCGNGSSPNLHEKPGGGDAGDGDMGLSNPTSYNQAGALPGGWSKWPQGELHPPQNPGSPVIDPPGGGGHAPSEDDQRDENEDNEGVDAYKAINIKIVDLGGDQSKDCSAQTSESSCTATGSWEVWLTVAPTGNITEAGLRALTGGANNTTFTGTGSDLTSALGPNVVGNPPTTHSNALQNDNVSGSNDGAEDVTDEKNPPTIPDPEDPNGTIPNPDYQSDTKVYKIDVEVDECGTWCRVVLEVYYKATSGGTTTTNPIRTIGFHTQPKTKLVIAATAACDMCEYDEDADE